MTQLHRIIYDLSSSSQNLHFQREFLNSYFNPKIDDAINSYHEHIKKMQKVALNDYQFIVERTDRFYQRKVRNLRKTYDEEIETLKSESIIKINELDEQEALTIQTSKELITHLSNFEMNYEQFVEMIKREIQESISQEIQRSDNEIILELEKWKAREEKHIQNSEKHMEEMLISHKILIKQIYDSNRTPTLNLQSFISKMKDIGRYICNSRNVFMSISSYQAQQLSKLKNDIAQLIREMTYLVNKNQNELKNQENIINSQEPKYLHQMNQLNELFNKKKCSFHEEVEKIENQLNLLISKLKEEYNQKMQSLSINNSDNESQIAILLKQLEDSFTVYKQSLENSKKKSEEQIMNLQNAISRENENNLMELDRMNQDFVDLVNNHKSEICSISNTYNCDKNVLLKQFANRLEQKKEYLMNCVSEDLDTIRKTQMVLQESQSEIEIIKSNQSQELLLLDRSDNNELSLIKSENQNALHALDIQLKSKFDCLKLSSEQMISDLIKKHENEKAELIALLEDKHKNHLESIQNIGDFAYEIDELKKEYSEQHRKLLDESKNMVPFIVNNDAFADMNFFIKDLQSELEDHIAMVNSNRRCLNLDWEQKLQNEYQRIGQPHQVPQNTRARNQSIQSYKQQIAKAKQNRDDIISKLKAELSQLHNCHTQESSIKSNLDHDNITIDQNEELVIQLDEITDQSNRQIEEANQTTLTQKKLLNDEISPEIKNINDKIKSVIESTQERTVAFQKTLEQLNSTLISNRSDFMRVLQDVKAQQNHLLDQMKCEFLKNQHLLLAKCQEQNNRNQRNADAYQAEENEQFKQLNEQLKRKEMECLQAKSDLDKQRIMLRDNLLKRINDTKGNTEIVVKKVTDTRNVDTRIDLLEKQLHVKSILLNNSIRELMEYKSMYASQDKLPTKNFPGNPDIGIRQFKQMRANIDVI